MKTFKRINELTKAVLSISYLFDTHLIVADIGTDHGYLAESLSKQSRVNKIVATDISDKSLSKLQKLIETQKLKKIETAVGDGLLPVERADVCVIAGMGAFEIISILKNQNANRSNGVKCRYFVLQPAQNVIELRKWLASEKISVLKDYVILDADRFYPILIIDVLSKKKLKLNTFNTWLGRDNDLNSEDFVAFLQETKDSLDFLKTLPKLRIWKDRVLREKYKLYNLIEKLLKV